MNLPELPVSLYALMMCAYLCGMSFTVEMVARFQNLISAIAGFYIFGFSLGGFATAAVYWLSA